MRVLDLFADTGEKNDVATAKVRGFKVEHCDLDSVKRLIEAWHYSGSVNGLRVSHCFRLLGHNQLLGGMVYGGLGMANAWKKYADKEEDVLELRRLACIDDAPRNSESFFVGRSLRWLKKHTNVKTIVSYADAHYGHSGTIYKASNFSYAGMTAKSKVIQYNGQSYHDKTIRTTYKGRLKPFAQEIKDALDSGLAQYEEREPKHIFIYEF
jgi:hypothetical protein